MSHSSVSSSTSSTPSRFPTIATALVLDAVLVITFAAIGRGQHELAESLSGLWATAWPFLAGLVIAWIAGLVWREPLAILRSGLVVWIGTVVLGLLFRVLFTDGGAATAFVIVATLSLAVLLLGWRLIALLIRRARLR